MKFYNHPFECLECGNTRPLLGVCIHCGSKNPPNATSDTVLLNLERGLPSAEEAIRLITEYVRSAFDANVKAIILIHGYGSSGKGGRIKYALHEALEGNIFTDRVDEYYYGEEVPFGGIVWGDVSSRRIGLKDYMQYFKGGNKGITLLLMRQSLLR